MPSSSRSPSRRRATPSSRLKRSPARTFLATGSAMAMEPQLRDPVDEAEGPGPPVELPQAGQLSLAQVVHDVPAQVRLALRAAPRAEPIVLRRDLPEGRLSRAQRLLQALDARGVDGPGATGPEREDERQPGAGRPFLSQIEAVRVAAEVEGGIA